MILEAGFIVLAADSAWRFAAQYPTRVTGPSLTDAVVRVIVDFLTS